jgi:signal transduction histidine kinase
LLDATRIDIGILNLNNGDFNLTEAIHEVVDEIRKKLSLGIKNADVDKINPNIQLALPSHPLVVYADKDRIAQVLSNLLDNAIRFTNSGTITVSAKLCSSNLVKVRGSKKIVGLTCTTGTPDQLRTCSPSQCCCC